MLRHIISVSLASLAMTACASLIPVKANGARLILIPIQPGINGIQRNPGDSIEFVLLLDEINSSYLFLNTVELRNYSLTYDDTELSLVQIVDPIKPPTQLNSTAEVLARYIFKVLESVVKDGKGDISATAEYRDRPRFGSLPESAFTSVGGPLYDVEPVPEPLTIFGTATALGYGAILKRKSSKKKVS